MNIQFEYLAENCENMEICCFIMISPKNWDILSYKPSHTTEDQTYYVDFSQQYFNSGIFPNENQFLFDTIQALKLLSRLE